MPASIIALADAIVTELNAAVLSVKLRAERHYQPRFDIQELADIHVSVVPASLARTPDSRKADLNEYEIDIAVQKRVEPTDFKQLDDMAAVVEELADFVRRTRPADYPEAICTGIRNEPIFSPEHLEQKRTFTSVLIVTYQVRRELCQ
jgi:hypothetical protein